GIRDWSVTGVQTCALPILAGEPAASEVARNYQPGGKCSVAYNPSDPTRCFLDTSLTWHTWGKLGIGAVAGIAGLVFLILGLKNEIGRASCRERVYNEVEAG